MMCLQPPGLGSHQSYWWTLQESTRTIPGVTELRAFHGPALGTMWKDIERVLKQHQDKVVETKQELDRLADEPAYLRASDLKKAKEAIERLLKELEDQRLVFLEYVGRCVQVQLLTARAAILQSSW